MFNTKDKIENDYWDGVFESIWGTYRDEENELYRNVYENEINEFIDNLRTDLDILLRVYGSYDLDDIERLFAIQFYGTFDDLENPENLANLAIRFDEIYSGDLGDKPKNSYDEAQELLQQYHNNKEVDDIDGWYE
ncbi:MAG: hypothetical protein BWY47_00068 [Bacteroidetes bacterium ADurb.Bin302]|nr:MAG: hypothetical protein BWY47_00068 [Bacteroidetes bacterium ADurb.Bin302]